MVILIAFVMIIFMIGIGLALMVVIAQGKAKKDAQVMLKKGITDKKKLKKTLKVLSQCKDNEGKRLYNKLADIIS